MRSLLFSLALAGILLACSPAQADEDENLTETLVYAITPNGLGEPLGILEFHDTRRGLVIKTDLEDLPPGAHGFHMHDKPDCSAGEKDGQMTAGLKAGGHYDPKRSGKHHGPAGEGHLGDLPLLIVDQEGRAEQTMLVPRLKMKDISGHSFVIHEGGDNYSDVPLALGGGGKRIACAVVF